MAQEGVTPEQIFEAGDTVRWKRQSMDKHQVDFLINKINEGFTEPFYINHVRNFRGNDLLGMGHSQELVLTCQKSSKTLKITGWWFEKVG